MFFPTAISRIISQTKISWNYFQNNDCTKNICEPILIQTKWSETNDWALPLMAIETGGIVGGAGAGPLVYPRGSGWVKKGIAIDISDNFGDRKISIL